MHSTCNKECYYLHVIIPIRNFNECHSILTLEFQAIRVLYIKEGCVQSNQKTLCVVVAVGNWSNRLIQISIYTKLGH